MYSRKKIVLIGSSMTQRSFNTAYHGWGAALANWYARTADVFNRGAGGYNSRLCKKYFSTLLEGIKPDMSILFIGNNDAIDGSEKQHVPVDEYKDNIIWMLEYLNRLNSDMIILLVTPTKVNSTLRKHHSDCNRQKYVEVLRELIKDRIRISPSLKLSMVDIWTSGQHCVVADDLHDGAHLNVSGNRKVFDAIKNEINLNYPFFSPDSVRHKGNKRRSGYVNEPLLSPIKKLQIQSDYEETKQTTNNDNSDYQQTVLELTVPLWHDILKLESHKM